MREQGGLRMISSVSSLPSLTTPKLLNSQASQLSTDEMAGHHLSGLVCPHCKLYNELNEFHCQGEDKAYAEVWRKKETL